MSSPGLRRCSAGKRMLPPPPRTWDVVSRIITHHHHHYHHHHPPPSPAPAQCQFQARPLSRTTAATIRGRSTRADVSNTITTTADQTILPPQRTQSVLLVDEKAPRSVMAASPETRSLAQGLTGLKVPTGMKLSSLISFDEALPFIRTIRSSLFHLISTFFHTITSYWIILPPITR